MNIIRKPLRHDMRAAVTAGLAAAAVLLIGGCTLPSDDWRIVEAKRDTKTEWQIERAYVRFLDRSIQPIQGDLGRLTRFLVDRDVKETDRIQVSGSGSQDPLGFEAERVRTVAEHLRAIGYEPSVIPPVRRSTINPLGVDSVRVTVGRFVATMTGCPDWSNPTSSGSKNLPASNHGCFDKVNLAVMLDQPRDLVAGRGSGSRLRGEAGVISAQPDIKAVETYGGSSAPGVAITGAPAGGGAQPQGVAAGNIPSASGSGTLP